MLSSEGWLDGLSIFVLFLFGCALGLIFIYKSRKTNARLLFYAGVLIFLMGFIFLGAVLDFLVVIIAGVNMDNTYGLVGLLSYVWVPPMAIIMMYIGVELLFPKKKRIFMGIYLILAVIYYLFLFSDPFTSITFNYPSTPGDNLLDFNLNFFSFAGVLLGIYLVLMLVFNGFGFLLKSFELKGIMKKKYLLFSAAVFIYFVFSIFEAFTYAGIALVFIRMGVMSSWVLWYFSLREEPETTEKVKPKKEVRVEGGLFRISEIKREDITEEEISISKEKKICLICKGDLARSNIYLCPECSTLYCLKCSEALSNMENACWVCNTPFNDSKPSKPYESTIRDKVTIEESTNNKDSIKS